MVTFIQETSTNSIAHTSHNVDTEWLQYFSLKKALITVADHVAQLPSSSTPEKHTWKVYQSGLKYFLNYTSGARLTGQAYDDADIQQIASLIMAHGAYLPSKEVVMRYIAHLKTEKGISARTIASRYLAPMRHYLDALIDQHIKASGEAREYVYDCKQRLQSARRVKNPRAEKKTTVSALEQHGTRLTYSDTALLFERMSKDHTLSSMRDYALIRMAFDSCLRVAELQRITLSSFYREDDTWLVVVRGKRGNMDPVAVSDKVFDLLLAYVERYNAGLGDGDPRRIESDTPVWQPLIHGDNYAIVGVNNYDPMAGASTKALRGIFKKRTIQHLGREIKPHDARRTTAKMLKDMDAPLDTVQRKLRHSSMATTAIYIGKKQDHKSTRTDQYVTYDI